MATPLATGVAALYLERDPSMTPAQVKAAMIADSVSGAVVSPNAGTPSNLLSTYKFALGVDNEPVSNAPTMAAIHQETSRPSLSALRPTIESNDSDMPSDTPTLTPTNVPEVISPAPTDPTDPLVEVPQKCTMIFGSCSSLRDPACCSRTCWVGTCMPIYID